MRSGLVGIIRPGVGHDRRDRHWLAHPTRSAIERKRNGQIRYLGRSPVHLLALLQGEIKHFCISSGTAGNSSFVQRSGRDSVEMIAIAAQPPNSFGDPMGLRFTKIYIRDEITIAIGSDFQQISVMIVPVSGSPNSIKRAVHLSIVAGEPPIGVVVPHIVPEIRGTRVIVSKRVKSFQQLIRIVTFHSAADEPPVTTQVELQCITPLERQLRGQLGNMPIAQIDGVQMRLLSPAQRQRIQFPIGSKPDIAKPISCGIRYLLMSDNVFLMGCRFDISDNEDSVLVGH